MRTRAHAYACKHIHTRRCAQACTRKHTCKHGCTRVHTRQAYTRMRRGAHTCTRARVHWWTCTDERAYAQSPRLPLPHHLHAGAQAGIDRPTGRLSLHFPHTLAPHSHRILRGGRIASTNTRRWIRLVGRRHDLHIWSRPEVAKKPEPLPFKNAYCALSAPEWLVRVLEPIRVSHFGELTLYLPATSPGAHFGPISQVYVSTCSARMWSPRLAPYSLLFRTCVHAAGGRPRGCMYPLPLT